MARVAILTQSLTGGGVPKAALTIARELIGRENEVDLLFLEPVCAWSNDDVPDGMRFLYLTPSITAAQLAARRRELSQLSPLFLSGSAIPEPAFVGWQLRQASVALACRLSVPEARARIAFKLAAYLDRERPDGLLIMGRVPTTEWAAFSRCLSRHRPRTVATLNLALLPRGRAAATLLPPLRRAYSSVDAVVAVSRALARFAVDVVGTSTPVHHVSEPLVDFRALRKAADPVDHPWIGGDVPVVLSVARLEKDYPTLLRAVALLAARRPVRLIALGKAKEAARLRELQDLARALGVAGAVDFAGFAANPLAYMARAELFVLSSEKEGMPQVLVQAMMVGCRMVATDCDFGPAELFAGEEYGRLAPVGDAARLAEAMDRELDTPRDAARLRARAAELFDVERSIDAYEALLGIGGGGTETVPGRIRPGGDRLRRAHLRRSQAPPALPGQGTARVRVSRGCER